MKLVRETQKILDDKNNCNGYCGSCSYCSGHSEAVNVEFTNDFDVSEWSHFTPTDGLFFKITLMLLSMPLYAEGDAVL
jgi:aspartate-semialdehyde dehydrogenase